MTGTFPRLEFYPRRIAILALHMGDEVAISNREYFLQRAVEERRRAERAQHANVARVHAAMAERYRLLAEGKPVQLGMVQRG